MMTRSKQLYTRFHSTSAFMPLLIVFGGVLIASVLIFLRPTPPKTARQEVAIPVTVIAVRKASPRIIISGFGTVEAQRELELRSQVSGRIVELHPQHQVGGRIAKGELLARIDPRDYRIAVQAQEAALARSEFELQLEQGNQIVAEREWKLLEDDLAVSQIGKDLALRKPHLREKKAALEAARSQLQRAQLDLQRTELRSPFSSVVLDEDLEIGTFVSAQSLVARIAAVDAVQVKVKISRHELRWFELTADGRSPQTEVTVIELLGDGTESIHTGKLVRILGDVDQGGQMAQILVSVQDPFAPRADQNPLLIGTYVRVELAGKKISDVFEIPSTTVREGNLVWTVTKNGRLEEKKVNIAFEHDQIAYVRGELTDGESIITTPLENALRGALLKVAAEEREVAE